MQIEAKKLLTWTQAVPTAQRSLLLLWWSLLTLGLTYFGVKHIEGGTVLGLFGWPFGRMGSSINPCKPSWKFLWLCTNKSAVYPILCRKTERLGKEGITSTGRFKSMIAPAVQ